MAAVESIWTRSRGAGEPAFIGGHRGASTEARENSLASFEQAVTAGADFIEFDWRLTRDGVPVVYHDETLERQHGDAGAIDAIAFADLRAIDPGLVTVEQALDALRGRVSILLDTKITDPKALGGGIDVVTPYLRGNAAVAFGIRSLEAGQVVRRRLPESPVLGLFGDYVDYPALRAMGGTWARLWEDDATAEAIGYLHSLDLKVIVMAGQPSREGVGVITLEAMTETLSRHPDAVMLNDVRLGLAARAAFRYSRLKPPGS